MSDPRIDEALDAVLAHHDAKDEIGTHRRKAQEAVDDRAAAELRANCIRRLAQMHNIVALRGVKLEGLGLKELRDLWLVITGIQSKLTRAEQKAQQPWRGF